MREELTNDVHGYGIMIRPMRFIAPALLTIALGITVNAPASAQGTFDKPQKLPGGGEQYEFDTPLGRTRVTKTPIKVGPERVVDTGAASKMMGNTGDLANIAIIGVIGLGVLGGAGWLLMTWVNGRARSGQPDLGGWKPVSGYR